MCHYLDGSARLLGRGGEGRAGGGGKGPVCHAEGVTIPTPLPEGGGEEGASGVGRVDSATCSVYARIPRRPPRNPLLPIPLRAREERRGCGRRRRRWRWPVLPPERPDSPATALCFQSAAQYTVGQPRALGNVMWTTQSFTFKNIGAGERRAQNIAIGPKMSKLSYNPDGGG